MLEPLVARESARVVLLLLKPRSLRVQVQNYAYVHTAIVGWYSKLGRWSRLDNNAVLGEDVSTKDEVYLNGAVVLPHKEIKESVMEARIIM